MCEICRRMVCPSGCPNADEPAAVYECELCGEKICKGDMYINYEGEMICDKCSQRAFYDYLKHFGYIKQYAGGDGSGIF